MIAPHDSIVELVRDLGYQRRAEAFRLSSGQMSHDYIDGKRAISTGPNLVRVADAIIGLLEERNISYDAVGGLTMGADPLAHAVAIRADKAWFSVRKAPKKHGRQSLIEGCEITPGLRVVLVDDVVTTGRSILDALSGALQEGASVVFAVTLVDRGDSAQRRLAEEQVPYQALVTYRDLGIEPVIDERVGVSPP
ncbi:MAG: orotate phosphoribosyltransferase [Actinomycetota bacterium]